VRPPDSVIVPPCRVLRALGFVSDGLGVSAVMRLADFGLALARHRIPDHLVRVFDFHCVLLRIAMTESGAWTST
jgi:hypothetical protein